MNINKVKKPLSYLIPIIVGFTTIFPLIWMAFNSLKSNREFLADPWGFPLSLHVENYAKAWVMGNIRQYMTNSFFVTSISLICLLVIASLAAFSFARLKYRGNNLLFYFFLAGLMFPPQVIIVPLYSLIVQLGLVNKHFSLIFTYIALNIPFSIFFLRAFFLGVPQALVDAAKIDGCNNFGVFWRIMLPIIKPGIAIVAVLKGVAMWNEFLFALLFIHEDTRRTISAGILSFFGKHEVNYTLLFSGLNIVILPLIILLILFQKAFIKALTAGSLKF